VKRSERLHLDQYRSGERHHPAREHLQLVALYISLRQDHGSITRLWSDKVIESCHIYAFVGDIPGRRSRMRMQIEHRKERP
jgi:hypothetical protein